MTQRTEASVERSTVQRICDVEQMVTSFRRHLRAENKADQTVMAYTYAPLQLGEVLRDRGMPTEVANIRSRVNPRIQQSAAGPLRGWPTLVDGQPQQGE